MSDSVELFNDMFGVSGDETIQEQGSYKVFENGDYRVIGIHTYLKKDERDDPIFVPQGDSMVARFKLTTFEIREGVEVEVEGPPMSATYQQMVLLVRAFGGDVSALSPEPTSKFLLDAKDQINRARKVRKATVKDGWVKFVEGSTPPAEAYTWQFKGFRSNDGSTPVRFITKNQTGPNGAYDETFAYADFVIVGNRYELDCPYNGYRVSVKMKNPFDGGRIKGKYGEAPSTASGQKGGIPIDVKRFREFCATFCNMDLFQHAWTEDVERSEFGINEFENPLPVIDAYARKAGKRAIAKLGFNKHNYPTLDMTDFIPAVSQGVVDLDKQQQSAAKQPTELEAFYDYVVKKYGNTIFLPTPKDADEINLAFTADGINWAKSTLVPIWTALDYPVTDGKRYIANLTPEQLVTLTNELRKLNGDAPDLTYAEGIDSF